MWRTPWAFSVALICCVGLRALTADNGGGLTGPDDNEDDIPPWPCPDGFTWHRCHVNLSCFETSEEEAMAKCKPGCYCPKRRFLYKGQCITEAECPEEDCPEGMEYTTCGNYCKELCPGVIDLNACASEICYDGCFCRKGLKRFAGSCYEPDDCPTEPIKLMRNFLLFNTMDPSSEEEKKTKYFMDGPMAPGH